MFSSFLSLITEVNQVQQENVSKARTRLSDQQNAWKIAKQTANLEKHGFDSFVKFTYSGYKLRKVVKNNFFRINTIIFTFFGTLLRSLR